MDTLLYLFLRDNLQVSLKTIDGGFHAALACSSHFGTFTLIYPPHQSTTPELRFSSKYAERVAAKHPATLDRRFIHPRPGEKEE